MSRSYSLNYAVGVFLEETDGIHQSKRAAKRLSRDGVSDKIHSYGTRARYCGIVKDFVEKMRSQGVRRVNQLKGEHLAKYLHDKAGWTTEKTMKVNMSALTKFFKMKAIGRRDLVETIEANRGSVLRRAKPSGHAVPFSNPEKVIGRLKRPESKAIATIMLNSSARIDDVPKVVHSVMDNERTPGANLTILIKKSKGGRDRELDFDDRVEKYELIREAARILNDALGKRNWVAIKAEAYRDLRVACDSLKETYTGFHAFRANYAQRRHKELMEEKGVPEREALQKTTKDLGHNRVAMALTYIRR